MNFYTLSFRFSWMVFFAAAAVPSAATVLLGMMFFANVENKNYTVGMVGVLPFYSNEMKKGKWGMIRQGWGWGGWFFILFFFLSFFILNWFIHFHYSFVIFLHLLLLDSDSSLIAPLLFYRYRILLLFSK